MARTRKLPKELLTDEALSRCSMPAVLFFFALFDHFDRFGLISDDAFELSRLVFPKRRDVTEKKVEKWLSELEISKKIQRLTHKNQKVLFCREFVASQYFFSDEASSYGISSEVLIKLAPELASKLQVRCPPTSDLQPSTSNLQRPPQAARGVAVATLGSGNGGGVGEVGKTYEERLAEISARAARNRRGSREQTRTAYEAIFEKALEYEQNLKAANFDKAPPGAVHLEAERGIAIEEKPIGETGLELATVSHSRTDFFRSEGAHVAISTSDKK